MVLRLNNDKVIAQEMMLRLDIFQISLFRSRIVSVRLIYLYHPLLSASMREIFISRQGTLQRTLKTLLEMCIQPYIFYFLFSGGFCLQNK